MTRDEPLHDPVTRELLDWIQHGTERIGRSTQGLSEAHVRTPVVPSGWTVAGLVGHVLDSTSFWLTNVVAGHPMDVREDAPWDNDPELPFGVLLDQLRSSTARACAAVAHLPHTAAPGWWPEGAWGGYRQATVRGVLLHLLNDNAADSGQLDIARELIDGGVWDFSRNGIRPLEDVT